MPKLATPRPPVVYRSSGSRVTLPTRVTVLSAIGGSLPEVAASGGGAGHAAALGLGLGQADELVADDFVRESQGAFQVVERPTGGHRLDDEVVAGLLAIDRVGELA